MLSQSRHKKSTKFPNFVGRVYKRPVEYKQIVGANAKINDKEEYAIHAYQYATSSRPGFCQPAAIIYATNESDIRLAIQYAKDESIAIAVRSGGHQFWGASSTSGDNIQLDMSGFNKYEYNEVDKTVTCGAGVRLDTLTSKLAEMGAFIPHGQCGGVCMGGHLQSGGYSVLCGRSFGFCCDHVTQFCIITADLEMRVVRKPANGETDMDNDELWFAVLGGSPGNFGVVTEMTFKPLWDKDYSESRGFTFHCAYSREAHEALLNIVADYNDKYDLPADFNICVFVLAGTPPVLRPNIDTKMLRKHPEIYGGGMPPLPAATGLWASWCNLGGGEYTQEAKDFFADLEARVKPFRMSSLAVGALKVVERVFGKVMPEATPEKPIPMSVLSKANCWSKRVHANPYISGGVWCGQSRNLSTNGFAKWAAEVTMQVQAQKGCYADFEWIVCGGKHSKMLTNSVNNPCALAWRDVQLLYFQYIHYDNTTYYRSDWNQPKEFAEQWLKKTKADALGENGIIGKDDRRWNAFPEQDDDLDKEHKHYFQTEDYYQRVLNIKRKFDPNDIFTPNLFGIGASRKYGANLKKDE